MFIYLESCLVTGHTVTMSNSLVNPAHYGAANHGNMHSLPYHETVSMGSPPPPHTAQEETPHEPVNFEFCCRNADGGRMARVSGFQSMIELYAKLAQVLEIQSPSEVSSYFLNSFFCWLTFWQYHGGQFQRQSPEVQTVECQQCLISFSLTLILPHDTN